MQLTQSATDQIDVQLRTAADSQSESQNEHLRFAMQLTQSATDQIDVQLRTAANSQSENQNEHLRFELQLTQFAADLMGNRCEYRHFEVHLAHPVADLSEVQLKTAADSRSESAA
jgi:hypothetical protein